MKEMKTILALLRSALTGAASEAAVESWKEILLIARRYQITLLVLLGAERGGIELPKQIGALAAADLSSLLNLDERQRYLADTILRAFSAEKIDYAPLKGLRLKTLYPEPAARSMGDVDILIRPEQLALACGVMKELGFELKKETHHELVFSCSGVEVELHKCLIPPYDTDYYDYYRDDWSFFRPSAEDPYCYQMGPEDEAVYLVTHFAKHYRDGGIGPKHLIDLFLLRRKGRQDEARVFRELKKLGLDTFYRNLIAVMENWFEGKPDTEITEFLTKRLFSNGAWGTKSSVALAEDLRRGGDGKFARLNRIRWVLFPPADYLKFAYPVLQRSPAALPIVWVRRWADRARSRTRIRAAGEAIRETTDASVTAYREELEYVGLGFFKQTSNPSKR